MTITPPTAPWRSTVPAHWQATAVYAIRFATRPSALRGEHFYGHDDCADASMPIDYFVWLIAGDGAAIMVDAGYTPDVAASRPGREHLGSPLEIAEWLGYPAAKIPSIIISHAHYDHTGYISALPESRVHIQERELAFWVGRHAKREMYKSIVDHDDIAGLVLANFDGRVDQYDGVAHIAPGVSAHLVGGHTPGTQVVRVRLADDRIVVIASDASHFYENIREERPFSIAHTVPDMFDAFDTIRALVTNPAGVVGDIIPGHDPLVRSKYPIAVTRGHDLSERAWLIA